MGTEDKESKQKHQPETVRLKVRQVQVLGQWSHGAWNKEKETKTFSKIQALINMDSFDGVYSSHRQLRKF